MNYISDILFWISTGLLVPTIVLLVLFFVRALLLVGGFFGQLLARRKADAQIAATLDQLTADNVEALLEQLPSAGLGIAAPFYHRLVAAGNDAPLRERVLAEFDIAADADQNLPRTLAKMVGLSSGDIASMAYNMQVAFATTVVGLVIGAIGTLTVQVKKRWLAADAARLDFIEARLAQKYVQD